VGSSTVWPADVRFRGRDWSYHELGHFHRLVTVLWNSGLSLETDRGVTDEGEPWFVFCDSNSDVFAHFARIGGQYVVCGPCLDRSLTGPVLRDLLEHFVESLSLHLPQDSASTRNL
jgi:hypothetical protein